MLLEGRHEHRELDSTGMQLWDAHIPGLALPEVARWRLREGLVALDDLAAQGDPATLRGAQLLGCRRLCRLLLLMLLHLLPSWIAWELSRLLICDRSAQSLRRLRAIFAQGGLHQLPINTRNRTWALQMKGL